MTQENKTQRKKVTVAEIAAQVGVSKATVSFVLSASTHAAQIGAATRQRIFDVAEELGYRPNAAAKALATGRSMTVLMVLFERWDEHLAERLRGAEEHLVPLDYSTRICTVTRTTGLKAFSAVIQSGQADGILLSGLPTLESLPLLSELTTEARFATVPIVALADSFPRNLVPHIADIDDNTGATEVVSHLISHGHHRIAFLGVANQLWSENRRQGYEAALKHAGIAFNPTLVYEGDRIHSWAYQATQALVRDKDFTGLFAVTDGMALAAMAALKDAGRRIPQDCAVVGFDNSQPIALYSDPPLTTVDNPFVDTGLAAARMLTDLIDGKSVTPHSTPVSLIIRHSCGC